MASKKSSTKSSTKKSSGTVGTATVKSKPENVVDSETSGVQTLADTPQYLAAYSPKTWINGETIYDTDLNHAEQGIADAQNTADAASDAASAAQSTADAVEASALTGVKVNGATASVSNHVASIELEDVCIFYGTCSTAYSQATKVVEIAGTGKFAVAGDAVEVYFENKFVDESPKLNCLSATGNIFVSGNVADEDNAFWWTSGTTILFICDGKYWRATGYQESYYFECDAEAGKSTKSIAASDYVQAKGTEVTVMFTNGNTVQNPTLNVGSLNNITVSGDARCEAGECVTFIFNGARRWVVQREGTSAAEPTYDSDTETLIF